MGRAFVRRSTHLFGWYVIETASLVLDQIPSKMMLGVSVL